MSGQRYLRRSGTAGREKGLDDAHDPLPPLYSRVAVGLLVLAGFVLCYLITAPFLPALVWALTLAVLFAPLERRLRYRLCSPGLSVSVTIAVAAVVVVAPTILVSAALIDSIAQGADATNDLLSAENPDGLVRQYPALPLSLDWLDGYVDLPQLLQSLRVKLEGWGASLILGSITSLLTLLLTFYFLFYMLRDRVWIIAATGRMLPLAEHEYQMLAHTVENTIFASVYGTAAVAALQGFLGGLVFWWLDLPSPVFWGVIMGLLAIVPFLGAFVVWVPVALVLALEGQWVSSMILALWGTLVVGLIDNIVYPILVGRQLALHSMLSFIAIIGGIAVFGAHGLVLGPLIVAATMRLLEILRTRMDGQVLPASTDNPAA